MKGIISFILSMTMLASVVVHAEGQIGIEVNDVTLDCDVAPIMENDRVLVPMRAIFEALGATIEWDDATQTVTATRDEKIISLTIDDTILHINEDVTTLDVPARLVNDRTLVPIRAVSESLGAEVGWNDEAQIVSISLLEKEEGNTNIIPTEEPTNTGDITTTPAPSVEPTPEAGEAEVVIGSNKPGHSVNESDYEKLEVNTARLIAENVKALMEPSVGKPQFAASGEFVYYVTTDGKQIFRTGLNEKHEELYLDMSKEKSDTFSDFTITGMRSAFDGRIYVCGVFNKENNKPTERFAFTEITSAERVYQLPKLRDHKGAQIAYVKDNIIHINDTIFNTDTGEVIKDNAPVLTGKDTVFAFERDGIYYRYIDNCIEHNNAVGKVGDKILTVDASRYTTKLCQGKLYNKDEKFADTMSFAGAYDGESIVGFDLKRYSYAYYIKFDVNHLNKGYTVINKLDPDNMYVNFPFEFVNLYHRLEYVDEGVFVAYDKMSRCLFTITLNVQ